MAGTKIELSSMSTEECWERLRSAAVGRLGITIGALPVILPVFFAVIDQSIVFRTSPEAKLSAATSNTVVAFEADEFDVTTKEGWSVVVQGITHQVDDPLDLPRLSALLPSVSAQAQLDRFVKVTPATISGRRVDAARLLGGEVDTVLGRTH